MFWMIGCIDRMCVNRMCVNGYFCSNGCIVSNINYGYLFSFECHIDFMAYKLFYFFLVRFQWVFVWFTSIPDLFNLVHLVLGNSGPGLVILHAGSNQFRPPKTRFSVFQLSSRASKTSSVVFSI
jgi:hypothetical protein